jgi:hypothetical protein
LSQRSCCSFLVVYFWEWRGLSALPLHITITTFIYRFWMN